MPTDPLTASRYPASTAVPNVNQDIQNAVTDLADNTIPDFATTTTRDSAYTAWVALGNTMRNGLQCVVNGVPYRRIGGNWRIDRNRIITRSAAPGTTIAGGGANETGVTAGIAALASFTLYEASTVGVMASFQAGGGGGGVAFCSVKINNTQVGDQAISRSDGTVALVGSVALAAGTHTIALRVDAFAGASVVWTNGRVVVYEGIAE